MASNLFSSAFLGAAFAETQGTASAATFTTCLDLTSRSDSVARCTSRRRSESKSQSNFILRSWSWHKTSKSFQKKKHKHIFRIHVKQQFRRMPFMPMFNQCPYHLPRRGRYTLCKATRQKSLLDIFTNLIIWVGWHAFMGKILGSQTVDGYGMYSWQVKRCSKNNR